MAIRRPDARATTRRPTSGRRDVRSTKRNTSSAKGPAAVTIAGTAFTSRALVLLAVVLLLLASYTTSIHAWWQQRSEIHSLERQKAKTQDDIAALQDLQRRWTDPAFVKQQARERFGWVMPGEVGYRVIGSDGALRGQSAELSSAPGSVDTGWQDKLWGTFEKAGRGPDKADPQTPMPDPDVVIKDTEATESPKAGH